VDCKKCNSRSRADQLIEEWIEKKKPEQSEMKEKIGVDSLTPEARTFEQQDKCLSEFKIKCPKCGACDWTEPKSFNLMFKTQQ
jgi:glycyl-tRNA synthetase